MRCFEVKLFPVIKDLRIGDGASCRAVTKAKTSFHNISKIARLDSIPEIAAAQLTRLRTLSQGGVRGVTSLRMIVLDLRGYTR